MKNMDELEKLIFSLSQDIVDSLKEKTKDNEDRSLLVSSSIIISIITSSMELGISKSRVLENLSLTWDDLEPNMLKLIHEKQRTS